MMDNRTWIKQRQEAAKRFAFTSAFFFALGFGLYLITQNQSLLSIGFVVGASLLFVWGRKYGKEVA